MKPSLQVRLSQHLALTPQLQQSIRLLQLSTLELHQEVEQMLEQNPFLEVDDEGGASGEAAAATERTEAAAAAGSATADEGWDSGSGTGEGGSVETPGAAEAEQPGMEPLDFDGGARDEWENGTEREDFDGRAEAPASRNAAPEDEDSDWTERNTVAPSLADHLREQLLGMRLAPEDMFLVESLIDSLNEDGYLADPLEDVAERLAIALEEANPVDPAGPAPDDAAVAEAAASLREDLLDRLRCALGWLQNLEPAGVGARDLCECLQLQLRDLPDSPAREAALAICRGQLEALARRDLKRLMAITGTDEDTVREAQALIVALEPKPGRRFTRAEANIVVPDVIVQKSGRGWKVVLNPDVMPKLRINDLYAQVLRQHRSQRSGDEGGATLSARLQEARWFVKNILQRFDTIQRVSQAIVERQKGFFTHGEIAMKPLVLREIADELGLHESTISRVTTAKYMNTPFGTFELKYFFGSSLNTEAGGNASSTAVRALIKQFVAAEDAKKPLSDSQLSQMLEEQGIQVARRTVAKYREALKIAPANLRKAI
ncbi:MAG: RNA polymerase factor sigma-54 [Burkholderiaceae bacterium]|nr:RNA polymerase factor sigma-54 [Burkholderiaceae bacterium]